MMNKKVRTRFAPSPTGSLHLGGVRTALFNYLFAKHYQGEFLVRFEDTDLERNNNQLIDQQLDDLKWLGLMPDATIGTQDQYAPYLQSQRLLIYQQYAQKLLQQKQAYYCFCTKDELIVERKSQIDKGRKAPQYNKKCLQLSLQSIQNNLQAKKPYCIRLKVESQQKIMFTDLVYGSINFAGKDIEDFVLLKTNGYPTYNFAVVVDDHLMEITHIWRGSDHLTNTAKQIILYQTYQWTIPQFGHLTLLQMQGQKKMSKRIVDPLQYLNYFQQKGYLPQTIFNYLSLLGWTPDKFQELFSPSDLIAKFDGTNLNKAHSTFSLVKLNWINHKQIEWMPPSTFINYALPFCQQIKTEKQIADSKLKAMILFFQKEVYYFSQLPVLIDSTFFPQLTYQEHNLQLIKVNEVLITKFLVNILSITWTETELRQILLKLSVEHNLHGKAFFLPLRIAASGLESGPQMEKLLFFLGKEKVINNIKTQLQWIKK